MSCAEHSSPARTNRLGIGCLPLLDQCPNLKAVQLMGAGVDSVLSGGGVLPDSVPVARIVDPVMAQSMGTYVLAAVINIHRKTDDYLVRAAAL